MSNFFKTLIFLTGLMLLLLALGYFLGGQKGVVIAFFIALAANFGAYWYSDKIVLSMMRSQPITDTDTPELFTIIRELIVPADIPMPKVYLIPSASPNAFATGRDAQHAVIAVSKGLFDLLAADEMRGVLAHEIAHIRHRDILIASVAATLAGAIGMLVSVLRWTFFLGGGRGQERDTNPLVLLAMLILFPVAALLIQMAVSRSREYEADKKGAVLCGNPLYLASALRKIESGVKRVRMREVHPTTAHLFIVNPLYGKGMAKLFSTHPPIEERIGRLVRMVKY